MTWDKAQQQFALTITRLDSESDYYEIAAHTNSNFKIEGMGLIGSDGIGTKNNRNNIGALVNPDNRDDGSVNTPSYPVIKNKDDNPKYIVIYGRFKGDEGKGNSYKKKFVIKTEGLQGIIWENDYSK